MEMKQEIEIELLLKMTIMAEKMNGVEDAGKGH